MIWAAVPARVTVAVPLLVMVAPPPAVTASVPLVTLTVVVKAVAGPSTSATLTPAMASGVSSVALWAPGTVLTGGSLTAVTVTLTLAVSLTPPEVTV